MTIIREDAASGTIIEYDSHHDMYYVKRRGQLVSYYFGETPYAKDEADKCFCVLSGQPRAEIKKLD